MKPLALAVFLAALAGLALAAEPEKAPPDPRDSGPDKIDISSYPPERSSRRSAASATRWRARSAPASTPRSGSGT
jgi:hypothetical protein